MKLFSQRQEPLSDAKRQELTASFMLAEFNALTERARDFDQIGATRVNFYLIIVGAVGAGLGAAIEFLSSIPGYIWLIFSALAALLVLGLITLFYAVNSSRGSAVLYRRAGRVRCWFAELAPEAVPFFAWVPSDDHPRYTTGFWMFRGGEATLVTVNAIMISALVAILLFQVGAFQWPWITIFFLVVTVAFGWFLQWWFFRARMKQAEERDAGDHIHFRYEDYEALTKPATRHSARSHQGSSR